MKQIYHPYWKWEDYKNGMFANIEAKKSESLVLKSKKLLSNPKKFYEVSQKLIREWTVSARVNLTNRECNRRAWIGQAACCFSHKAPEYITRIAWNQLTDETRSEANAVAEKIILQYERENEYEQTVLDFECA